MVEELMKNGWKISLSRNMENSRMVAK